MRSECPGGLVLGPGIGRSPVRFPACARSVWCHFILSSLSNLFIDLGMVGDGFGMVFEKMLDGVEN